MLQEGLVEFKSKRKKLQKEKIPLEIWELHCHPTLWMHFTKNQLFNTDIVQDDVLKCVFCDRSPHGMPKAHQPRVFVTLSCLLPPVSDTSATDKISEHRHGFFHLFPHSWIDWQMFSIRRKKPLKILSFSYLLFVYMCVFFQNCKD